MSIPGYAVPGQIICPVLDKKNGHIRKYVAGHGVALTEIGSTPSNNTGVAALTATVVGKVSIKDVTAQFSVGSEIATDISEGDSSTISGSNTGAVKPARHRAGSSHKRFIFQVDIEDKFYNINSNHKLSTSSGAPKVTRASSAPLPEVGDVVLARVTKLTLRQAHVEILVVEAAGPVSADSGVSLNGVTDGIVPASIVTGGSSSGAGAGAESVFSASVGAGVASAASAGDVGEGFGGIIRVQDVRITERDKVKIVSSFRPGDIVRALVVS